MEKEKTWAEKALFHLDFAIFMLNVTRYDEANASFDKARENLNAIIAAEGATANDSTI